MIRPPTKTRSGRVTNPAKVQRCAACRSENAKPFCADCIREVAVQARIAERKLVSKNFIMRTNQQTHAHHTEVGALSTELMLTRANLLTAVQLISALKTNTWTPACGTQLEELNSWVRRWYHQTHEKLKGKL